MQYSMFDENSPPLELDQLNVEWCIVVSLREINLLTTQTLPTYRDMLAIAVQIAPEIFNQENSLLMRYYKTTELEIWEERAASQSKIQGKIVTAFDVLQEEINRTRTQIEVGNNPRRLQQYLARLEEWKRQLPAEKYSENQAIIRDAWRVDYYSEQNPQIKLPVSDEGVDYREFEVSKGQFLRVKVAHPERLESITGADIIYEQYDRQRENVRVVALQYKIWDGKQLYVKPDDVPRIIRQLSRLEQVFCSQVCKRDSTESHHFQMPPCAAYLRPTDRLQRPDVKMQTSGYHIPVCQLESLWEYTTKPGKNTGKESGRKLTTDGIDGHAIKLPTFEELFNARMLGSGWVPVKQLERLYEDNSILHEQADTITTHAQVYSA